MSSIPARLGRRRVGLILGTAALLLAAAGWLVAGRDHPRFSPEEVEVLRSLWIGSLPPLSPDPTNAVADDPRAAALGHKLFFDTRLSGNGEVACATCHQPRRRFTDGLQKGRAIGQSKRNTPSIVGTAYSPWLYWDGRKDSQWAQALSPLEDPAEQGGNRMQYVRLIASDREYRAAYESLFGPLPDFSDRRRFPEDATPAVNHEWQSAWEAMAEADRKRVNSVYANIGKAIAAYERVLMPGPSRFDVYVEAVLDGDRERQRALFTRDEARGLKLFIGEGRCIECHNGPLLTNNEFHNTGLLSFPGELPDRGRSEGVRTVQADPFNCLGPYSDDPRGDCPELRYVRTGDTLIGAFRTPSLRNLEGTAPFMHKGQMDTLEEVLEHYNEAPPAMIGHNDAKPLGLTGRELHQIEAFLHTLQAPLATDGKWLSPPPSLNTHAP